MRGGAHTNQAVAFTRMHYLQKSTPLLSAFSLETTFERSCWKKIHNNMSLLDNHVEWTSVGVTPPYTSLMIIERGSLETTDFTRRDLARWSCCFVLLSLQNMFQTKPR